MSEKKAPPATPGLCDWVPGDNREEQSGGSCDRASSKGSPEGENRSAFFQATSGYGWDGVELERYKADEGGWAAIARQVLVGVRGESAPFDLRYFEIAPGGFSSLEKHRHEHVVVGIRGRGRILLGGKVRDLGFLDTAYIAPDDPHQLINPHGEPFGFFCIVSHERDRPRPLDPRDMEALEKTGAGPELRR